MTAPAPNPIESDGGLDAVLEVLQGRKLAILTGAGLSTDSGIPDYRGAGAPPRNPMTFQQFLADEDYRKRYWAGSHLGWQRFSSVTPNAGHRAVAALEASGVATGVITQNVDGLHRRAGSLRVIELHGSMDRVRCLDCGQFYSRRDIASQLAHRNPWLDRVTERELGPDGDVIIEDPSAFDVPVCGVCGGMLKPDVVYFGEFVPSAQFRAASAIIGAADALLVAGSSLVVNSGMRLLDQAIKRGHPTVIVNRGPTKGDPRATVKLDAGTSEVLTVLAKELRG
ncbi:MULTISPECIES: Sir2 family NAD-dependent protein deacetylase [unclassified Cryobacterium]|uniref:Sir2 family NAD-dependent protein deacetylase n=1 Tax=unclassified Cryobacterium TaxID=2649013 RepID=UPI001447B2B5|nr:MULTISPECIES: Sir2 family NAD-dependent protein deacetylase [unclassified Cryobacterium]